MFPLSVLRLFVNDHLHYEEKIPIFEKNILSSEVQSN